MSSHRAPLPGVVAAKRALFYVIPAERSESRDLTAFTAAREVPDKAFQAFRDDTQERGWSDQIDESLELLGAAGSGETAGQSIVLKLVA